jgi:dipeptide transport system ATP-binding protein
MSAMPATAPNGATAPVAVADGLTRTYEVSRGFFAGSATLRAVDGISFTLEEGKTLGIVGESGCGKSTLARLITLIEPPSAGALKIAGGDVTEAKTEEQRSALRRAVQIVFQNPYGSLNPRKKVGSILEEPLVINTKLGGAAREAAAREMMRKVGLRPEHYGRYPHMFSGGQRQRIAIARALMLRPRLVVADEPVSALDVSIQAQVLNLLNDLQEEFRLSYLFISHDLGVVRHVADDVLVMYLGRPAEQGSKQAIFERPLHPYTQALLASTPGIEIGKKRQRIVLKGELPSPLNPPSGCAFNTRCPHAEARCRAERPEHRAVGGRLVSCHFAEKFL